MPTARSARTTTGKAPVKRAAPAKKPQGTWARLRAEAAKLTPAFEPYLIEDVEPPIEIAPPTTAEQQFALTELMANEGRILPQDTKRMLEIICADAFPRVWDLVRGESVGAMILLIRDIERHFAEQGAIEQVDEDDVPGGSQAS